MRATRAPADLLPEFFAAQVLHWLRRELPERAIAVEAEGSRVQVEVEGSLYQLRFEPDRCLWRLLVRGGSRWRRHVPDRPCLSLTDWLGRIRWIETSPAAAKPRRGTISGT